MKGAFNKNNLLNVLFVKFKYLYNVNAIKFLRWLISEVIKEKQIVFSRNVVNLKYSSNIKEADVFAEE